MVKELNQNQELNQEVDKNEEQVFLKTDTKMNEMRKSKLAPINSDKKQKKSVEFQERDYQNEPSKIQIIEDNNRQPIDNNDDELQTLDHLPINYRNIIMITIFIGFGQIQNGFALAGTNILSPLLKSKFGWHGEGHNSSSYNIVLIEAAAILGLALGSLFSGSFIKNGRRRTYLIFNFIGIFTLIPQLFENPLSIGAGRFLFGITTSILCNCGAKMIDEIIPTREAGRFGASTSIFMTFGMLNSTVLGILLPSANDTLAQQENQTWKILYAFPVIYQILALIIFGFYQKEDTIIYSVNSKNYVDALKMINYVYKDCDDQKVLQYFIKNSNHEASTTTLTQAISNKQYRKATWFSFFNIFLSQMSGSNVMNVISTRLFKDMHKNGILSIEPNIGSYLIAIATFMGPFASSIVLGKFGRKEALLWGNILMTIMLFFSGIFIILEEGLACLVLLMFYMFTFETAQGPIQWIYTAETCLDQAMGLVVLCMFSTLLFLTFISEIIVDSKLAAEGLIFMFCIFTFIGIFYIHFLCKETKGLNDKQKKEVFLVTEQDENSVGKNKNSQIQPEKKFIQMETKN